MLSSPDVTQLILRLREGDQQALEHIVPLLYDELRQLAGRHLRRERRDHTLNPTALVNEVYLKLVKQRRLDVSHRSDFLAVASRTMRTVLIDYARARKRVKRGGGVDRIPIDDVAYFLSEQEAEEVLALDDALMRLARVNERAASIVEYRFYGGLTLQETAQAMGVSVKTIQRSWNVGMAWLRREVQA